MKWSFLSIIIYLSINFNSYDNGKKVPSSSDTDSFKEYIKKWINEKESKDDL